jgi:hypothetical protein
MLSAVGRTSLKPHCVYDRDEDFLTKWLRQYNVEATLLSPICGQFRSICNRDFHVDVAAGAFLRTEIPLFDNPYGAPLFRLPGQCSQFAGGRPWSALHRQVSPARLRRREIQIDRCGLTISTAQSGAVLGARTEIALHLCRRAGDRPQSRRTADPRLRQADGGADAGRTPTCSETSLDLDIGRHIFMREFAIITHTLRVHFSRGRRRIAARRTFYGGGMETAAGRCEKGKASRGPRSGVLGGPRGAVSHPGLGVKPPRTRRGAP